MISVVTLLVFLRISLGFEVCQSGMPDLDKTLPLGNIEVEYISVEGDSVVMIVNNSSKETDPLQLIHKYGVMAYFPTNICMYTTLVKIDLLENKIRFISNISCLISLEILNLKGNDLKSLVNTTFVDLKQLISLDVSENKIMEIEPYAVVGPNLNVLYMNASNNSLTSVDITNIVMSGHFCIRDFSNNQVSKLTNLLDIVFDTNKTYGPGIVTLKDNPFLTWPEFDKLGIPNLSELGALFDFNFNFQGANFVCDCKMEPFLSLAEDVVKKIWTNVHDVNCTNPPSLKDISILNLTRNGRLDEFVCPIDSENDCPPKCNCTEQPKKSRLIVDCQDVGLTELPHRLPKSSFSYELNVCNNNISVLDARYYLKNVSVLKICNNELQIIDTDAIDVIKNITNLSLANNGGFLQSLPRSIQYLPGDSLDLRNLVFFCDCDTIWVSEWLQFRQVDSDTVYCHTESYGRLKAIDFEHVHGDKCKVKDFKTVIISICIAVVLILVVVTSMISYKFRYELRILFRRQDNSVCEFKYDIYISFDENNDRLLTWVKKILVPFLDNCGYQTYLPMRDCLPGDITEEEAQNVLHETKCFLVVLSSSYLCQQGRSRTEIEWKYAWDLYVRDKYRKIVLINFDHLPASRVDPPKIKAFIRVMKALDFRNRDGMHLSDIARAIGNGRRINRQCVPFTRFKTRLLRHRPRVNVEFFDFA
ncbi:hypothetical protein CHS0354_014355 [Potamilus streckersoni]|uniref:TIR domain-containing protein n=1 Tax=Potamilus streckersoni TaxID=2493646 RepID=A0AAE0SKV8_9BIVA|nr:hypothetical protein CHS0354_014355 [Potamilus streckersoni]